MRLLLASNAAYVPPRGGSTRSNLVWLEHMAAHGHDCRVIAAAAERDTTSKREQVRQELREQEIDVSGEMVSEGVEVVEQRGVIVHSVEEPSRRPAVLREQIRLFQPDWVLVSSEDLGHGLLHEAHRHAPSRIVYLAHTPQFYPFGPASWNPEPQATELVRQAAAVVSISRYTATYVREHTGVQPVVIHPPIYGNGPFAECGRFGEGLVTIVNPCAVKGISLFLAIAEALPEVAFGALPGWGTTADDLEALRRLPNVTLLPHVRDIEQVLQRTTLLLMPSLWHEGFGLIVMEAMLRGIPVISSDAGGLVEAKLGTGFVIPIEPISQYLPQFDDRHMPRPVLAPQNLAPWLRAVQALTTDRALYERESTTARAAALQFVSQLDASGLERMLASLAPRQVQAGSSHSLSPQKRALLLQRLRRQQ